MGLIENIRALFSNSKSKSADPFQFDNEQEKSRLASNIVNLVGKIRRINSFDSSVWNLSNISTYELKRKSLNELKELNSRLESRLSSLEGQRNTESPKRESLEASKWTGQKPHNMSSYEFDRFQRDEDR